MSWLLLAPKGSFFSYSAMLYKKDNVSNYQQRATERHCCHKVLLIYLFCLPFLFLLAAVAQLFKELC
jgi:hypothetical protein